MKQLRTGGGWPAIWYSLRIARRAGGLLRFFRALQTKNACKTCALGMGGQRGGMVDESGRFPEICKKSMQAMAADMQGRIAPEFWRRYSLSELARFTSRELEHMGRLTQPVYAGPHDDHYRPIDWEEAFQRSAANLRSTTPNESFFYSSGRSSNEAGFLMQLFARLFGTNNINNCSFYCHQASGVGLTSAVGSGTGTIELEDLGRCDLVFLIGGNPASNHPRLMRQLVELRRRGGEVIVVNPMKEIGLVNFSVPSDLRSLLFGSSVASLYVQPHIGGDIAFLAALAQRIQRLGGVDHAYLNGCCDFADAFLCWLESLDASALSQSCGVDAAQIDAAANACLRSKATIFAWTMGVTHHLHGVDNVRMIANLALMLGMVGKPGAGLMPIRGHSNVQGIGSVGVTPKLQQRVFERLETHFGVLLPTSPGLDTLSCLHAMNERTIKTGWCLGGNFFGANPDSAFTSRAMRNLNSLTYFSTTLNTGHLHGRAQETLVLPVLARDEEPEPTTQESMFSFVRLSEGGAARLEGPRSEIEVVAHIAADVLGDKSPIDWRSMQHTRRIREAIAAVVPGYEELARIDETREEFAIPGRVLHQPRFAAENGRAKLHVVAVPQDELTPGELRLMTIRSEGQFNTVVFEEEDVYRGQDRRDVIMMNSHDIAARGLEPEDRVSVRGPAGEMHNIIVRPFDIRAGNAAMYYPEANVLLSRNADPESRTPAFKNVRISISRSNSQHQPSSTSLPVLSSRDVNGMTLNDSSISIV